MNRKAPWVVFDFSWLAYRALYSMGGLSFDDMPTGVVFGVLEAIRTVCADEKIRSNKVAIMLDSRRNVRKKQFPEYKSKRSDITEEEKEERKKMYEQMDILTEDFLPACGFLLYKQKGMESDDLLAMAAQQLSKDGQDVVIVTADGDLYQCISDNVYWYNPSRNLFYSQESFRKKKGIEANRWGEMKMVAGCPGDGVPGVPKVGEKTAIKYLLGTLPKHYKTYQRIISEEGQKIIERNKKLVILPHLDTKKLEFRIPEYESDVFVDKCKKYGFYSFIDEKRKKNWEMIFGDKLRPEKLRKRKL